MPSERERVKKVKKNPIVILLTYYRNIKKKKKIKFLLTLPKFFNHFNPMALLRYLHE